MPTVVYNKSFSTSALTGGPRIDINYRMQLIKQRQSAAPFLNIMLNINNERAKTHEIRLFETRPNPKKALISGAVAAGASANATVTVNVATGKGTYFNVGDLVRAKSAVAPDADHTVSGIITAISTDALTVRPNDPAKTIAAMSDGDELQVWGNSFAQGTLSANPASTVPELKTFTTGIVKNAYQVNKTQANNRLYGAPERDRQRGEKEIEHLIEIEKQLLNGDGAVDTTNSNDPRTNILGLIPQFTSNVLSYGADLDEDEIFGFMSDLHAPKYAPDGNMAVRWVVASADVMSAIGKMALKRNQVVNVQKVFGMEVSTLVWPGRKWKFVEDPILSDFLPGWAIVFHPRYVFLREFRPTRLEANIQPNDADYFKDQFLTEVALETQLEELHGIIRP